MALNAPRYATVEGIRGDTGWNTLRKIHESYYEGYIGLQD